MLRLLTGRNAAVVAVISAGALLFVSILIGLRVPRVTPVEPFGSSTALDYRALRSGSFAPLRSAFIANQLGSVIAQNAPVAGAVSRSSTAAPPIVNAPPVIVTHRFTNDDIADAFPVSSVPFTARTNSSGATKQTGEPTDCAPVGGTAWYRYRAPRSVGLIANTFGSGYATALGVFTGTAANMRMIGCDTDAGGFAQVAFAAKRGSTYWFQIAGPVGGGDLVFNLTLQGVTTRSSLTTSGDQGNADSLVPSISADGRFVSFYSGASSFTPDTPPPPPCVATAFFDACRPAVFARDRSSHRISRVDVSSSDELPSGRQFPPEDISIAATMSADGRYVGFYSTYSSLVPNDTNDNWDVFTRDQARKTFRLVSVSSEGVQGNMASFNASLSADGRYVAFTSAADNLVPNDTNLVPDVFVHDTQTRRTIRTSVSSSGEQANEARSQAFPLEGGSHLVSMSANGRYVVFRSTASNLVPGDTNEAADYFLRDLQTRRTIRVSVSSTEEQANDDSRHPLGLAQWTVSDDGRYVFFNSDASNLVPNDGNGAEDLFVRDTVRGTTQRVSVSSRGTEANTGVGEQDPISVFRNVGLNLFVDPVNVTPASYSATPDGSYVVFSSAASNLVPGDGNEAMDVFLRHLPSSTTALVSVASSGDQGNGTSNAPVLSADARFVAFQSAAENLVPGDDNASEDIFTYEIPGALQLSGWF